MDRANQQQLQYTELEFRDLWETNRLALDKLTEQHQNELGTSQLAQEATLKREELAAVKANLERQYEHETFTNEQKMAHDSYWNSVNEWLTREEMGLDATLQREQMQQAQSQFESQMQNDSYWNSVNESLQREQMGLDAALERERMQQERDNLERQIQHEGYWNSIDEWIKKDSINLEKAQLEMQGEQLDWDKIWQTAAVMDGDQAGEFLRTAAREAGIDVPAATEQQRTEGYAQTARSIMGGDLPYSTVKSADDPVYKELIGMSTSGIGEYKRSSGEGAGGNYAYYENLENAASGGSLVNIDGKLYSVTVERANKAFSKDDSNYTLTNILNPAETITKKAAG
jgi:hypothetical protein